MTPNLHLLARKRRFILNDISTTNAATVVDDWRVKSFYFGRTILSTNTLRTVTDLVNGLMIDGIWPNIIMIQPCVNENISAVTMPIVTSLWLGAAQQFSFFGGWTNANLGINGMTGNGASYYQSPAFGPGQFSQNSCAIVWYVYATTTTGYVCGSLSGSNQAILCATKHTDGNAHGCIGTSPTNDISVASPGAGYYCNTRTGANAHNLYFANSTNPHASIGSEANASGTLGGNAFDYHAYNSNAGQQNVTTDTVSFIAFVNVGLSATDSSNFFNRIQAYRKAVGGGFV